MTADAQRYYLPDQQGWAKDQVVQSHAEALYGFGEYAMFVLMWTVFDFEAGLVARCPVCYDQGGTASIIADAYKQPVRNDCPNCFGTTFDGGYRAKIVRPTIWADDNPEVSEGQRGVVQQNIVSVETTNDFTLHQGDYGFRSDGTRWRIDQQGDTVYLRTGFQQPSDSLDAVGMNSTRVSQEMDSSVVWLIPPDPVTLVAILNVPVGQHALTDFSAVEDVRGPLTVAD